MSKYGYSLDVGDELEKELQEVESRISQYGKVGKSTKKETPEEDPLFGGDDEDETEEDTKEERKRPDKKQEKQREKKEEIKTTRKNPQKIKVERLEKEKLEHPQKVRLQTYTVKKEPEKKEKKEVKTSQHGTTTHSTHTTRQEEKVEHAQELLEQEEETDWVTRIVWIAVILLAGYFVWTYIQPSGVTVDGLQCAINTLSQNGLILPLNIEKETNADIRITLRDALTTPNMNEARTYYAKAVCGTEQNCTKSATILITPESLTTLGITTPQKCKQADNIIVCDNGLIIDGTTATLGNKAIHTANIVKKGVGTTTKYTETALQSTSVYEGKEGLQSITYPRELEGSTIIRMYTRDTLEDTGYQITYETENPRIVGYTIN